MNTNIRKYSLEYVICKLTTVPIPLWVSLVGGTCPHGSHEKEKTKFFRSYGIFSFDKLWKMHKSSETLNTATSVICPVIKTGYALEYRQLEGFESWNDIRNRRCRCRPRVGPSIREQSLMKWNVLQMIGKIEFNVCKLISKFSFVSPF